MGLRECERKRAVCVSVGGIGGGLSGDWRNECLGGKEGASVKIHETLT